ncbi:MAG: HNH endonuclease, partial [Pseudobdellovibrionaceae bacterium]
LKELPEIEEKIESGEISLSHINLAQKYFQKTNLNKEEKLEIFEQISSRSVREAEKITASLLDLPIEKPDRIQVVAKETIELKFQANEGLRDKIETLKGYLAHSNPNMNLGELFEKLCDLGLREYDSSRAFRKRRVINLKSKAQVKREVFLRAKNQCENCRSTYALEIDHIQPKALGGSDESDNLRLLCKSCNQRAAINVFGVNKMERFLS